jgi:predicted transcriptional regulator
MMDMVSSLPEDSSMDDIIDAIYVRQKIMKGLHDSEKGNVFSQEEAKEIIEKWLK